MEPSATPRESAPVCQPCDNNSWALLVARKLAQNARKLLEERNYWDDSRRLLNVDNNHIAIPVCASLAAMVLDTQKHRETGGGSFLSQGGNGVCVKPISKRCLHQSVLSTGKSEGGPHRIAAGSESGAQTNLGMNGNGGACTECHNKQEPVRTLSPPVHNSLRESGAQTLLATNADLRMCTDSHEKQQLVRTSCPHDLNSAESGALTHLEENDNGDPCSDSSEKQQLVWTSTPFAHDLNSSESGERTHLAAVPHHPLHLPDCEKGFHHSQHSDSCEVGADICGFESRLVRMELPRSKKALATTPYERMKRAVEGWAKDGGMDWKEELEKEIPKTWERHGDLVLLPASSFKRPEWNSGPGLWPTIAKALNCLRLARRGRIQPDNFRSPRTELLLGESPVVEHKDNGILYSFDIRYSMFSSGNITEKLRVASMDCTQETVVDLYAGIGYFTLPYLVHAGASLIYACEWNPHAVEALRTNLELNGVAERCVVLPGDNREVCPQGVADRVNLGLIPSSEQGWPVACAALKPQSGGILHIHANVTTPPLHQWNSPTGNRGIAGSNVEVSVCSCKTSCFDKKNGDSVQCTGKHDRNGKPCYNQVIDRLDARCLDEPGCTSPDDNLQCRSQSFDETPVTGDFSILGNDTQGSEQGSDGMVSSSENAAGDGRCLEETRTDDGRCLEETNTDDGRRLEETRTDDGRSLEETKTDDGRRLEETRTGDGRRLEETRTDGGRHLEETRTGDGRRLEETRTGDGRHLEETRADGGRCLEEIRTDDGGHLGEAKQGLGIETQLFNKKSAGKDGALRLQKWMEWGETAKRRLKCLLEEAHSKPWDVEMVHIQHVKSYAPHVDHIVIDMECRP